MQAQDRPQLTKTTGDQLQRSQRIKTTINRARRQITKATKAPLYADAVTLAPCARRNESPRPPCRSFPVISAEIKLQPICFCAILPQPCARRNTPLVELSSAQAILALANSNQAPTHHKEKHDFSNRSTTTFSPHPSHPICDFWPADINTLEPSQQAIF